MIPLFVGDLKHFFRFLKKNIEFMKNSLVLTMLNSILIQNFLKQRMLSKTHWQGLNRILVEENYFEDPYLRIHFAILLEKSKFRNSYQWTDELRDFVKTNFDFLDYINLKKILN